MTAVKTHELTHLDLFSGIGGFAFAARWAGFKTVGFCEIDKYCQKVLAKNFGGIPLVSDICQLLCALQNNKQLRSEISKSLTNANSKDESCESASGAAQCGHIQKASQSEIEADGSVRGDVVQQQCEDQMELIQAAENGCAEMETRIGRTATDLSESQSVMSHSKRSGGDGSLPEMDTPARSAGANRNHRVNSTRTMSNGGATSRNSDLKSLMDELYANLATRGRTVDLLTAGFPCQPYSLAGQRRGASDDRALWPRLFEVIEILRPAFCLLENVAGILSMELDQVLSDLESIGYACAPPFIIPACGVDAPHRRNRVWIVGHATGTGLPDRTGISMGTAGTIQPKFERSDISNGTTWTTEPGVGRVAHGVPHRVDRLKGLGNAIVPQLAFQILKAIAKVETETQK